MFLQPDWIALLRELNAADARYLVVGAGALAFHGLPRATRDFDIWVDPDTNNAVRVYQALARFGAPLDSLSVSDLQSDDLIFQIGVEPLRIDVITDISGIRFEEAWPNRVFAEVETVRIPILSREDLIRNKRATGREKDALDVKALLEER